MRCTQRRSVERVMKRSSSSFEQRNDDVAGDEKAQNEIYNNLENKNANKEAELLQCRESKPSSSSFSSKNLENVRLDDMKHNESNHDSRDRKERGRKNKRDRERRGGGRGRERHRNDTAPSSSSNSVSHSRSSSRSRSSSSIQLNRHHYKSSHGHSRHRMGKHHSSTNKKRRSKSRHKHSSSRRRRHHHSSNNYDHRSPERHWRPHRHSSSPSPSASSASSSSSSSPSSSKHHRKKQSKKPRHNTHQHRHHSRNRTKSTKHLPASTSIAQSLSSLSSKISSLTQPSQSHLPLLQQKTPPSQSLGLSQTKTINPIICFQSIIKGAAFRTHRLPKLLIEVERIRYESWVCLEELVEEFLRDEFIPEVLGEVFMKLGSSSGKSKFKKGVKTAEDDVYESSDDENETNELWAINRLLQPLADDILMEVLLGVAKPKKKNYSGTTELVFGGTPGQYFNNNTLTLTLLDVEPLIRGVSSCVVSDLLDDYFKRLNMTSFDDGEQSGPASLSVYARKQDTSQNPMVLIVNDLLHECITEVLVSVVKDSLYDCVSDYKSNKEVWEIHDHVTSEVIADMLKEVCKGVYVGALAVVLAEEILDEELVNICNNLVRLQIPLEKNLNQQNTHDLESLEIQEYITSLLPFLAIAEHVSVDIIQEEGDRVILNEHLNDCLLVMPIIEDLVGYMKNLNSSERMFNGDLMRLRGQRDDNCKVVTDIFMALLLGGGSGGGGGGLNLLIQEIKAESKRVDRTVEIGEIRRREMTRRRIKREEKEGSVDLKW